MSAITGTRLVDIDITSRVVATEVAIDASIPLDKFKADLRDAMAAHVARGFNDEAATVAVTVTVREV